MRPVPWPKNQPVPPDHSGRCSPGGTGGGIGYNHEEFLEIAKRGIELSPVNEVLIEESFARLEGIRNGSDARQSRQLRHYLLH